MEYYAHRSEDKTQLLREHLENTAQIAEQHAVPFMKSMAHAAGMAHDIGKYAEAFQQRLQGSTLRFEHSICGACAYSETKYTAPLALMLEYCIAGHHTGLPDGGTPSDSPENHNTLSARLKRKAEYTGSSDYSAYKQEVELPMPDCPELMTILQSCGRNRAALIEQYAFFTRYLFSCLTDADFLDTETFFSPRTDRQLHMDKAAVFQALEERFRSFQIETPLQAARSRLQAQAYKNASNASNISILNMPTGSGKTLCSLQIALKKLRDDPTKKRIIYVIPYTSIIEQTAELFQDMFGEYADILQHHSNYSFDNEENSDTAEKLKRATENWDAPLIITTSVQFFESMYHYRGSSLRKLHNTADSIIIFDEIHLLPVEMLRPCLQGIGLITKYLNTEAIFLSATMPNYATLFQQYLPDCSVTELIPDQTEFGHFKKCRYTNLGVTDYDSVLEKAAGYQSALIVVNKRKTANALYQNLTGNRFHLSTNMTPCDRSRVIAEIRRSLADGEPVTVISTSLIEAGVDLDFKAVFREMAGLDNILQAGGRCNREGRDATGEVFIFETEDGTHPDMQLAANIVRDMLKKYEDISATECIEEYYRRLFHEKEDVIQKNTIADGERFGIPNVLPQSIPFRSYAEQFRFIREASVGVVIANCPEAEALYQQLLSHDYSVRRQLQRYTVSLRFYEFEKAVKLGILDDFGTGVYRLTNLHYYKPETGLDIEISDDMII